MLSLLAFVLTPVPESPEPPEIPTVVDMVEDRAPEVEVLDPHAEQAQILEIAAEIEEERRAAEIAQAEQEAAEAAEAERLAAQRAEEEAAAEVEVAAQVVERNVWDRLADCESGNWVNGGQSFEQGSARWDWAKNGQVPPWGTTIHHGGLQFHPGTWDRYRPAEFPARAYDASREQQISVAEKVLASEGWGAWPTCASKLGLR